MPMLIQSAAVFRKLRFLSRSLFVLVVLFSFFSLSVSVSGGGKYILLYDCSDSVMRGKFQSDHLKDFLGSLRKSAQTDVFLFGGNAVHVHNLADLDLVRNTADPGQTDIGNAFRKAVSGRAQDSKPVVVFYTDGRDRHENTNLLIHAIRNTPCVPVVVIPKDAPERDIAICCCSVNGPVVPGRNFGIDTDIYSSVDTRVTLRVFSNGQVISVQRVRLFKGTNRITLGAKLPEAGVFKVRVGFDEKDDFPRNDTYILLVRAGENLPVLYLAGKEPGSRTVLVRKRNDGWINGVFPLSLENLMKYSAVVIDNVSAEQMDVKSLRALEEYVRKQAGSLLVTAGPDSLGPGGYRDTVLERILPVEMNPGGMTELAVLVDTSGSMGRKVDGIRKIDILKKSLPVIIKFLQADDVISMAGFSSSVSPLFEQKKRADLITSVEFKSLGQGGGTRLIPGLEWAGNILEKSLKPFRHIIIFSDGNTREQNYTKFFSRMKEKKISVSFIGIGSDVDAAKFQPIQNMGLGTLSLIREAGLIYLDRELQKKTRDFSGMFISRSPAELKFHSAPFMPEAVPGIHRTAAFIRCKRKEDAASAISAGTYPLLSWWRCGAGKTAVFASSAARQWSDTFLNRGPGGDILRACLDWLASDAPGTDMDLQAEQTGGGVRILAEFSSGKTELKAVSVNGHPVSAENIQRIGVRKYECLLKNCLSGAYPIELVTLQAGKKRLIRTSVSIPFAKEIIHTGVNPEFVHAMQKEFSPSAVISESEKNVDAIIPRPPSSIPLQPYLLAAAALIFLFDAFLGAAAPRKPLISAPE